MAKRKRIAVGSVQPDVGGRFSAAQATVGPAPSLFTPEKLFGFAAGLIAAAIIFAAYWPADSTEVQTGAARYLAGMLIIAGGIAIVVRPLWNEPGVSRADKVIDTAAWGLALSMVISTWINADGSNLRLGVNEMWWWVAAAALLSAARRICLCPNVSIVFFHLIISVTLAVAVFGWHQQLIGIPAMIEMYESDPEAMLRAAGIQATEGSGLRIVFHNRLYDGGPTGTFALANSMAALLVGGLVVMLGLSIQRWTTMTAAQKVGWAIAIVIVGGMLVASRSRSAAGSLLVVTAIALTRRWWDGRILTIAKASAAAGGVIAILAAVAWRFGRNTEWIGQAPASLEVRWRYWIASIKMIAQSPLFGVGPGQFKARYELYRADASTEQIADPHNWFWQIATTGGLVAVIIALVLIAAILWRLREPVNIASATIGFQPVVLYRGAGVAVAMIWIGGAMVGYLPTIDAGMLATVAGGAIVWLAIRSDQESVDSESPSYKITPQRIAGYAVLAMAIDLMAAGGLIVPGVATALWLLIAIACTQAVPQSTGDDTALSPVATTNRTRVVIGGAVTMILIAWYMTAILPIEQARAAKGRFEVAWGQGRVGEAESALRQAASADRWDAEPMMQLAAVLSQAAVAEPQNRQRWEAELQLVQAEAIKRVGNDPVAFRQLGDGQLRLFQRYGEIGALKSAESLFSRATSLAPAHEAYAAQLAEIYRQLGDQRSETWAERAVTLSAAGGYYERSLPFVVVMPAQFIGESVVQGEVRRPASEVLPLMFQPQRQQPGTAN